MSTNCHKLQIRLLNREPLDTADQEHLVDCSECRGYRELLRRTLDAPDPCEPPEALDRRILHYARKRANKNRPWPILDYLKWSASVAALILFVFVGLRIYRQDTNMVNSTGGNQVIHSEKMASPQALLPELVGQGGGQMKQELPDVVEAFHWDDDPIDAELAKIEAEFMLFAIDDEYAGLISRAYERSDAE